MWKSVQAILSMCYLVKPRAQLENGMRHLREMMQVANSSSGVVPPREPLRRQLRIRAAPLATLVPLLSN